jgi:septum formation protein
MKELGVPFRVVDAGHGDELYPEDLREGAIAQYLAELKSEAYTNALSGTQILLTADTIVWHQGRELGKPADREEAIRMITSLTGNTHQVYTGVCLRSAGARKSFYACTDVSFSSLEPAEIEHYVDLYKPYDKAGAYGIQEWIGYIAVERIDGSYFNVMGLPIQKVYTELKKLIS